MVSNGPVFISTKLFFLLLIKDKHRLAPNYYLAGLDICQPNFLKNFLSILNWAGMSRYVPTLVLCEVVLPYLDADK